MDQLPLKLEPSSYTILQSLHEGATADTWLIRSNVTGQLLVRKQYSTLGIEDAAEPTILSEIDHPHVVEILDARYDPDRADTIVFTTPYYPGGSLHKAMQEGQRFSLHHALKLATQTLDALTHLHEQRGLIHRDVKPSNVFLNEQRTHARLGDFGSAAEPDADGAASAVQGTPLYKPPEAGPTDGRHGVPGDIYATGLSLFELLNGPFDYASVDYATVDRRLSQGLPALPASALRFEPHVPGRARTLVRKALRPRPDDRHESCRDFITEINRVVAIDWRHVEGHGLDGTWVGTWPPQVPVERRRRYSVESRVLRAGPNAGRRRLRATQATGANASFAAFGVPEATVDPEDASAVEEFFDAVAARAAHLAPAAR